MIQPAPYDLNFQIPMIWNRIGNGWQLMTRDAESDSLIEFIGMGSFAEYYVTAGMHHRAQLVASLFYKGLYMPSIGLTAPTARCFGEPNNPAGIALLTTGAGAEGSGGAKHYANPTVAASGRFANAYPTYGKFSAKYGTSLVQMTVIPNATMPNISTGGRVTDTIGPTYMRDKFWRMAVQTLVMNVQQVGGSYVAATQTNAYNDAISKLAQSGITQENFLGVAFGPRKFWIAPQLDSHPYYTYDSGVHMTDGDDGGPSDMWININAAPKAPTYAKLGCSSASWTPTFFMYGPGDAQAQRDRMMRFEGDIDAGASAGAWQSVQLFVEK